MRHGSVILTALALASATGIARAQDLGLPDKIVAGSAFTVQTSGSGQGTLLIVGPGQVISKSVQLGHAVSIAPGTLYNAGHYTVILSGAGAAQTGSLDVTPESEPAKVSFLARPSRLPVGLRDGITGAVYVFDSYRNLITSPTPVSFQLSAPNSAPVSRTATTRDGSAWIAMDSSPKEGAAHFVARAGDASTTRIIAQVPGDPCGLKMTAKPAGKDLDIETDPVRDCSGNAVPDGTIVTFTENYNGEESTVDVPLKRGIAKVELPAHPGATISVASGVVLGNQIRWGGK
ncbi:MAG: hypothetical protein ACLGSD_11615 [Acidobacteriota bacterium]